MHLAGMTSLAVLLAGMTFLLASAFLSFAGMTFLLAVILAFFLAFAIFAILLFTFAAGAGAVFAVLAILLFTLAAGAGAVFAILAILLFTLAAGAGAGALFAVLFARGVVGDIRGGEREADECEGDERGERFEHDVCPFLFFISFA